MIKLELNKTPCYAIDVSGYVTILFEGGVSYSTCQTLKMLGVSEEEPEEAEPEPQKITDETLLSVIAMFTDKKEIPR